MNGDHDNPAREPHVPHPAHGIATNIVDDRGRERMDAVPDQIAGLYMIAVPKVEE